VAGIAAPVFGLQGQLAGAVTLTMPSSRFDEAHVEPTRQAARRISAGLGFGG
jgi:DNA-binding IclR family transcriptional regulator